MLRVCIALLMFAAAPAQAIQKCQDADGKWHYGDFVANACAREVIVELDASGRVIGEIEAPRSLEVLRAESESQRELELQEQTNAASLQHAEDIVHAHSSEQLILSTRARKLRAIDTVLEVTQQIRDGMQRDVRTLREKNQTDEVRKQIKEREVAIKQHNATITASIAERRETLTKYDDILRQFRAAVARIKAEEARQAAAAQ